MRESIESIIDQLRALAETAYQYASLPWFLTQAAIIVGCFIIARLIGRPLETWLEGRARSIKGHPGVLRVVVALMRRIDFLVFAILLYVALTIMREVTWYSRSYIISIALSLTLVWVAVSVIARIIRNRAAARILAWLAWSYAAIVIVGLEDEAAELLESVALPIGDYRLTALFVLKAALLLAGTIWIALVVGNFAEEKVNQSEELTPSIRVLIGKIAKIGLVVVAGVAALSAVGIDLTALTVFSGAVGVGLGFGLQKVVSNFISGIIILLDKSIKPGDTISLGDTFGWIRELRARFVSVITRDGREFLIPNEDFVTQQVINWSFSDKMVRLDVPFGVSYDSDPHQVTELAINAALSVSRIEGTRKPVCWLTGFGDSSLDFVLRFWIQDPQQGLTNIRGRVLLALWDAFKANDIEIPYPHRQVIMSKPVGIDSESPRFAD